MADSVKPSDPWSEPTLAGPVPQPEDPTVLIPRSERDAPPPAAGAFEPGELLAGRFRVVRFLGHGGMGDVYEAEDEEVHGRVALKTVRAEIARQPGILERFGREIHLARKVTHPNVCRIFDISHHGDVTFLTMELLPGETLEHRLKRDGAMREEEALPIARQMAEGLAAAHKVGVVHRDFKPANVMLVPEDGGARYVTEEVQRGNLVVTVSATGRLQPTNQVDVGSELSGTIAEVLVDDNDRVRKGQVLARLDLSKLEDAVARSRASLAVAEASVLQAQATVAEARATLSRFRQVSELSGGRVPSIR